MVKFAWSFMLITMLISCGKSLIVLEEGALSVNSTPSVLVTLNPASPPINTTNESAYLVSGTCSDIGTSNVDITVDGSITQTIDCTIGGVFSTTIDLSSLSDNLSISIDALHTGPLSITSSDTISVVKDTIVPTISVDSAPIINLANQASYTFNGSCSEIGQSISYDIDSSAITGTTTCNAGNVWSVTLDASSLTDNVTITILADHSDAAGNPATQASLNTSKDTIVPTVAITSSPTINIANETNYTFSGTCSESGEDVSYDLDSGSLTGTASCTGGNTWSVTINTSSIGDTTSLEVSANHNDAAGNPATQASVNVLKDTVRPTPLTLTSPANGSTLNSSSQTIAGTCETGATVDISGAGITGTPSGSCTSGSYSISVTLTAGDGAKAYSIDQIDAAGNSMATPVTGSYTLDTGVPTVAITSSPVINLANHTAYTVSGTCSEATRNVSYDIGGITGTTACTGGNTWSVTEDVNTVGDSATVSITADHDDAAGNNATQATASVVKDTVRPTPLTLTSPANGSSLNSTSQTMAGTCETGATVDISGAGITGTPSGSCTAGSYSISVTLTAGDGAKAYSIDQTDAAGNSMATPVTGSYNLDETVPTVTILSSPIINLANHTAYTISGACTESGRNVSYDIGGITGTTACTGGNTWSVTEDVNTVGDSATVSITADHDDAAGNNATQATASVVKDTVRPTPLTLTSPAASSTVSTLSFNMAGTCEIGASVSITGAGMSGAPFAGTCSGAGTYSIAITLLSGDGTKAYSIDQTDAAGNSMATPVTGSYTLDTGIPSVAITSSPVINLSNHTSYTISGTCSEATRDVSYDIGGITGTATCSGANTWSATEDVNTVGDSATVAITADHDDAGGNDAPQASVNVLKDTIRPTILTLTTPADTSSVNNTSQTLVGTCEANASLSVSGAGTTGGPFAGTCTGGGAYSIAITLTSGDGAKAITITETDVAGNAIAADLTASLTLDTGIPTVAITSSPVINLANHTAYTISGTCSEATRNVSYDIGGITGTTACSGGNTWSVTEDVNTVGDSATVAITADHDDAAGNNATQATASVVKDTVRPTPLTLTSPANGSSLNNVSQTMTGTCETGATVDISGAGITGTPSGSCTAGSYSISVTLTAGDGAKAYSIDQTDAAGNSMATPVTGSYTLDTGVPTVAITSSPVINLANHTAYTISGTCSEATRNVSYDIGGITGTTACTGGNTWSVTEDVNTVGDSATVSITADHDDAAGNNATQATASVVKDTVRPTPLTLTSPANGSSLNNVSQTMAGTCETGATVDISGAGITGTPSGSCTAGSYSISVTLTAGDGSKAYSIDQTDAAGNSMATPVTGSYTLDTTAATISTISSAKANGVYGISEVIDIVVTFDESVTTSTSSLTLDTGATASYQAGSGSTTITYRYTVGAGETSVDLSVTAFNVGDALNAASIAPSTTLPSGQNLDDNKNIGISAGLLTLDVYVRETTCASSPNPSLCYTSLGTAVNNIITDSSLSSKNLVSQNATIIFHIQESWTSADANLVSLTGWTTDATHFLTIQTEGTARHNGTATCTTCYKLDPSSAGTALDISSTAAYTLVDGMIITDLGSASDAAIVLNGDQSKIKNIIFSDLHSTSSGTAAIYIELV